MAKLNLATADEKIAGAMFQWIRSGLAGCRFATTLATVANQEKWRTFTVPYPKSLAEVDDIEKTLVAACGSDHEAVILIFPDIESVDDLVRLINNLLSHPSWT